MTTPATLPLLHRAGTHGAGHPEGDGKLRRRAEKQEAKRRRDALRHPDSWERFRMLQEVVDEQRNVVEIADHKARYALLIIGVLNAVIFVLLGHGGAFDRMPTWAEPWLLGVLVLYAALTFLFVYHAIDCLRPRFLNRGRAPVPGLLFWEAILEHDPAGYRHRWDEVRMEHLTAEAALVAYQVARLIHAKYRALRRLYAGLAVLVFLCTLLLAAFALWGTLP